MMDPQEEIDNEECFGMGDRRSLLYVSQSIDAALQDSGFD